MRLSQSLPFLVAFGAALSVAGVMPHCWSAGAFATRRLRAINRGFIIDKRIGASSLQLDDVVEDPLISADPWQCYRDGSSRKCATLPPPRAV